MIKLAISGKICSGKSTLADAFDDYFSFKHFKFAKAVYEAGYEAGMSRDPELKDRKLLQSVGKKKRGEFLFI